jgi:hypothetical protein
MKVKVTRQSSNKNIQFWLSALYLAYYAEKPFTLSQFIEKLQHFEISFDGKKTMRNSDFGIFETSPRCHGNRKFTIEHAVTEAMM